MLTIVFCPTQSKFFCYIYALLSLGEKNFGEKGGKKGYKYFSFSPQSLKKEMPFVELICWAVCLK